MESFEGGPHHAMQVCRDFWHRVECYLDGPESSLEYWKQEKREKPLGDWSLNTIKTSRQSVTLHTHQDRKLPNYFHIPDTVPFPEPLWLAKNNSSHQNLTCGTDPPSRKHFTSRRIAIFKIVQPEPVSQSALWFANVANGTLLAVTCDNDLATEMILRAAPGWVTDTLLSYGADTVGATSLPRWSSWLIWME